MVFGPLFQKSYEFLWFLVGGSSEATEATWGQHGDGSETGEDRGAMTGSLREDYESLGKTMNP